LCGFCAPEMIALDLCTSKRYYAHMEITKEHLKALRIQAGITQAAAAEMVHLKRRDRWMEYESGVKEPDPARIELFLIKLAIKYGVRPGKNREEMLAKLERKMKNMEINQIAEELRIKALKKETSELDQLKLLAAHHSLLGNFKEAGQCEFQYKLLTKE